MSWRERLQEIVNRENQEEEFEEKIDSQINSLKSKLKRGENPVNEAKEILSEEEQLERELLDLEEELLDLLTFEDKELEDVLETSKEFLNWKVESLREIEACLEPLKNIEKGLTSILNAIENPSESPNIDLHQVGWQEIVDGSERIFEIFDKLKQEEQEIFEDFNQRQEDSTRFLEKLEEERQAITKIQNLVQQLKSEQGELEGLETIQQSPELKQKLGEEENQLSTLVSNLERLEEIDEKLESVVEERKELAEEANERDLSELKKLYQFINTEYEDIISKLEKLEEMNQKNYFTNQEDLERQIRLVRESVEMVEEYINERYNLEVSRGISRRGLLKGMGAVLGGWTGLDTAINVYRQASAGQFEFMNPKAIGGFEPAIRNSIRGKSTEVYILNVFFEKKKYQGEKVAREVEEGINSLKGVNFNLHWYDVNPSIDRRLEVWGASRQEISEDRLNHFKRNYEQLRKMINNTKVMVDEYDQETGFTENVRINYIGNLITSYIENLDFTELVQSEAIVAVLADFQVEKASGVSFASEMQDNVIFTYRPNDQTRATNILIHELGHKLSLPHTVSPDIMSYSVTSQALQKYFKVPFGPESRANWDKVKNLYRE